MRIHHLLAGAAALVLPGHAFAQEEFSVNWHTIDCGGGSSNGDDFTVLALKRMPLG